MAYLLAEMGLIHSWNVSSLGSPEGATAPREGPGEGVVLLPSFSAEEPVDGALGRRGLGGTEVHHPSR